MVSQRALHRLAEDIYRELERDGFFDTERPRRRAATRRSRPSSRRGLVGATTPQRRRAPSARSKAYGRAFKRLAPKYKKKNGGWKKDGFARCVRAAHRAVRK